MSAVEYSVVEDYTNDVSVLADGNNVGVGAPLGGDDRP